MRSDSSTDKNRRTRPMVIGHPPGAAGCFAEGVALTGTEHRVLRLTSASSVRDSRWLNLGLPPAQQKPQAITRLPVHRITCSRIRDLPDCSHFCRRVHNLTQTCFLETRKEHPFHVCARRLSPQEARKWWRSRLRRRMSSTWWNRLRITQGEESNDQENAQA